MAFQEDPTDGHEWEQNGRTILVPKAVLIALKTPYRGQGGFNKHKDLLDHFHDNAYYKNTCEIEATLCSST